MFNASEVESSSPFCVQFQPQQVIEMFRRLKKVGTTINLQQKEDKQVELEFQFFASSQFTDDQLTAKFNQQVVLKSKSKYDQVEADIMQCTKNAEIPGAVTLVMPAHNLLQILPLTAEPETTLTLQISAGKRSLLADQPNYQVELISQTPQQADQQQTIVLSTENFVRLVQFQYLLKKVLGKDFVNVLVFSDEKMLFEARKQESGEFWQAVLGAGKV